MSVDDLKPSSSLMESHIARAFYVTYSLLNILDEKLTPLDPLEFGYEKDEGHLKPKIKNNLYPPIIELSPPCTCKQCVRKTCKCIMNEVPCIDLCACKIDNTCRRN